jgi:MFS family permease
MTLPPRQEPAPVAAVPLVASLIAIYIVSQFLRNSIGVIAPTLAAELQLSPGDIGLLSSAFFLVFALVQIPVGMALDRFGPRLCLLVGAAVTVLGSVVFASAGSSGVLILGRVLLGLGTAASLVASLAVYAQRFPPGRLATLAGLQIGLGTFGTLLATAPLAYSTALIGWRGSFLAVGVLTFLGGLLIAVVVRDEVHAMPSRREGLRESLEGTLAVLRTPSLGCLFVMNLVSYSTFGLVIGLWGGPYLTHIYGLGLEARGDLLLIPVIMHMIGSVAWGSLERLTRGYKLPVLAGAALMAACLAALVFSGKLSMPLLIAWLAAFGFLSAFGPLLVAHGMALFPSHQLGRGLTVLNMGAMGGTFLVQAVSGYVIGLFPSAPDGGYELDAYRTVFGLQAGFVLLASLVYARAHEPAQKPSSAPNA